MVDSSARGHMLPYFYNLVVIPKFWNELDPFYER